MKLLLTIALFLFYSSLYSQKYSKIISDKEVVDFMTWLLAKDNIKTNQYFDNELITNDTLVYTSTDSIKNPLFNKYNIFNKTNKLDTFITKEDAKFFIEQVKNQNSMKWNIEFPKYTLVNYPKYTKDKKHNMLVLDSLNKLYNTVLAFSLPIFSIDKRKVLIIERFYCGIACGGGSFNLYEKDGIIWKKVMKINQWAN